jgi:hypothetical protein
MAESLEAVANRIAQMALRSAPPEWTERLGVGPVVSVVRDDGTLKIYVGFNTGVPRSLTSILQNSINAQRARISNGEVKVVHTDADARDGGHAEVNALNAAIRDREQLLGRRLVEADLQIFELHNIWLSGPGRGRTVAARCEHCRRITRGVSVTQSVFIAEGGRVGEISVPTGRAGSSGFGAAIGGLLTGALVIGEVAFKQWFGKNYLEKKWKGEERAMVLRALTLNLWRFQGLITTRLSEISKSQQHGKRVILHVSVDTEWVNTDLGPAMKNASVSNYELLFEGDIRGEWPLFQPPYRPIAHSGFGAPRTYFQREVFDFPL